MWIDSLTMRRGRPISAQLPGTNRSAQRRVLVGGGGRYKVLTQKRSSATWAQKYYRYTNSIIWERGQGAVGERFALILKSGGNISFFYNWDWWMKHSQTCKKFQRFCRIMWALLYIKKKNYAKSFMYDARKHKSEGVNCSKLITEADPNRPKPI